MHGQQFWTGRQLPVEIRELLPTLDLAELDRDVQVQITIRQAWSSPILFLDPSSSSTLVTSPEHFRL